MCFKNNEQVQIMNKYKCLVFALDQSALAKKKKKIVFTGKKVSIFHQ